MNDENNKNEMNDEPIESGFSENSKKEGEQVEPVEKNEEEISNEASNDNKMDNLEKKEEEIEKKIEEVEAKEEKVEEKLENLEKKETSMEHKVNSMAHPHPHKHIAKKRIYHKKDSGVWKMTAWALFALLIISIFTNGFSGTTPLNVKKDVNKIAMKDGSQEVFDIAEEVNDKVDELIAAMGKTVKKDPVTSGSDYDGDAVKVEFYVMSQCPYGTQVEDAFSPVFKELGSAVDFHIDFIADETAPGVFRSLHGQTEVDGNIAQLCAIKYEPEKYIDMLVCMNKNAGAIPGNWEKCAEDNGLNVEAIKACYEGEEGIALHSESAKKANARGATGSPTIFINDAPYSGARDTTSFKRAVCSHLDNHEACADIPACASDADCPREAGKVPRCQNPGVKEAVCVYEDAVAFEVVVLNDEACSTCDTTRFEQANTEYFPGVTHRTVDAGSDEGKELIEKYDIVFAPTFLFDKKVMGTETWAQNPSMSQFFNDVEEYLILKDESTGAAYYISEEKRAEEEAKLGNYPAENLKALGVTGELTKPRFDYFVMAFCPFGNPADEAAALVSNVLGDTVDIVPHYIMSASGDTISSLHGEQEGNQGVRELCALETLGFDKFFAFTLKSNTMCNSNDADTCWESAAEAALLTEEDVSLLQTCYDTKRIEIATSEGNTIAQLKTERSGSLVSPTASPTFLVNGKTHAGSRSAEAIKNALCAEFEAGSRPAGCDEVISEETSAPQGNC